MFLDLAAPYSMLHISKILSKFLFADLFLVGYGVEDVGSRGKEGDG